MIWPVRNDSNVKPRTHAVAGKFAAASLPLVHRGLLQPLNRADCRWRPLSASMFMGRDQRDVRLNSLTIPRARCPLTECRFRDPVGDRVVTVYKDLAVAVVVGLFVKRAGLCVETTRAGFIAKGPM